MHNRTTPPDAEDQRRSLLITAAELAAKPAARLATRLQAGGAQTPVIVDCRFNLGDPGAGHQAYLQAHLPGAFYADLDRDLAGPRGPDTGRHPLPDPAALRGLFDRFGITNHSLVVAYDDGGGMLAARLWWLLRWMGHREVVVLDGGLDAWLKAGLPVTGVLPPEHRPQQPFAGTPGHMPVMPTAELEAALKNNAIRLLDVRAAERYAGHHEPIDPVAGHVPGAVNAPCADNLDASRHFRPRAELAAHFAPLVAGRPGAEIVCMCGSGVTACHGLLALELAGVRGAALYPGSWSEWIRSPDRPISRSSDI